MDDPASLDLELLRELVLELIRTGTITDEMIGNVERRFESEARRYRGSDRAERYEQLAHMASVLPVEAAAPTATEFEAEQRRKHIRLIPDGGNHPT